MEKFKRYLDCYFGGIFAGIGCFYFAEDMAVKYKEKLLFCAMSLIAAILFIYMGSILVLPQKESRMDAIGFILFGAGVLCTGIFGK